jgi:GNAT superfamily N-acetyltransferase
MKIRQIDLHKLTASAAGTRHSWLETACACLRSLPSHFSSRFLVAEEDGQIRAVLGLRMFWGANGRLNKAVICVLVVDPEHGRRGIGARLVRFAEGIARIHGCTRVDVAPGLEGWCEGHCWTGLGYDGTDTGLQKVLGSPVVGT